MTEPVLVSGERVTPISEVRERSQRLAGALAGLGVGHGDRYAIVMRNETAYLEVNMAAALIGAVPVPVNWHWTGRDLEHLLTDSGSKVIVVHTDLLPAVEQLRPAGTTIVEAPVPPEVAAAYGLGDVPATGRYPTTTELIERGLPPAEPATTPPMAMIYTSGTTGLAKGVLREPIAPEHLPSVLQGMIELAAYTPGAVTLAPAPLYHSAPNINATFAVQLGISQVIMPRFDPEEFLRLVERHRVTTVQMVPTMFVRMLQLPEEVRRRYDLSSLELIVHAAAPCPVDVKRAMIDWVGPILKEYYGGSEAGAWVMCGSEEWLAHPGTVGKPYGGTAVKILDDDKRELPVGETGIIYGRSAPSWPDFTYHGNDEKRAEIDGGDGFVTVGDVGRLDEDGYLYLSDRLNDMVISGGVNIYPAEIEAALLGLEGVADAAVFGIPDRDMGEALAAHIQLRPGASLTEEQVREYVRTTLAKYKAPKIVVFDDELPREDSGKLFKRRLKEHYWPATS